jgi:hypothetical protein
LTKSSDLSVSISGKLLGQLRIRAAELEVPVKWLVVGLVCDTVEHMAHGYIARRVPKTRHASPHRKSLDVSQCA